MENTTLPHKTSEDKGSTDGKASDKKIVSETCGSDLIEAFNNKTLLYESHRSLFTDLGYKPFQDLDYHFCAQTFDRDDWRYEACEETPELEVFGTTGVGNSRWTWQKDKTYVRVFTVYENYQIAGIECTQSLSEFQER